MKITVGPSLSFPDLPFIYLLTKKQNLQVGLQAYLKIGHHGHLKNILSTGFSAY